MTWGNGHEQQASQELHLSSCHWTACGGYERNIYIMTEAVYAKRLNVEKYKLHKCGYTKTQGL